MKLSFLLRTHCTPFTFKCIFIALLLNSSNAFCQNTFYRTLGHVSEGSEGRNVAQAADGGYYLTYYIYYAGDYISCITKMNCSGLKEWEMFYDGGMVTLPSEIIPQKDNSCLFSFSIRTDTGEWQHAVMKVDASGNTEWTTRLKMHVGNITGGMVQHSDGNIYICGNDTVAPNGIRGTTIAKLGSSGNVVWQKHYADGQDHTPLGLTITSDNKIAVFGMAGFDALPFTNLFVFTTNLNGQFIKRKIFSTYYDDEPKAICSDKSGNIYVTGNSYFINSEWDVMFLKLNSDLNILQSKFIDGATPNGEKPRYIIYTTDNSLAIFGDEGTFDERNPMLLKCDLNGNTIWSKRYTISPLFTNYLFHGAQCDDGGFLMTGDTRPLSQFRIAPFMKTTADGNLGCFTSDFIVTERNEIFQELDTMLNTFTVLNPVDDTDLPPSGLNLITGNTAFCQQLTPYGNFTFQQDTTCPVSCYTFYDQSINSGSWLWTFENGIPSSSTEQHPPQVCFQSSGIHEINLTLTNPIGGTTYTQQIVTDAECPFFIPNVFTPDGDGVNDLFYAQGINDNFSLQIFNRWGQEIFKEKNPGKWWNGNLKNGEAATEGVYYYILYSYTLQKNFSGVVHLKR
ncbi:MAG: gliding motility-associated C-terminal domain-containing protein [Bacteroidetes bacterium]|nr:gliding motility-associated C-terminal domain-containing protein [Bacteroidota bacterium]